MRPSQVFSFVGGGIMSLSFTLTTIHLHTSSLLAYMVYLGINVDSATCTSFLASMYTKRTRRVQSWFCLMILRGNRIKEKFLSMYSYRIGAWSQCQYGKKTIDRHPFKTASTPQVYGHTQWCFRKSNSGEDIDMSYCSWNPNGRIVITLSCQ